MKASSTICGVISGFLLSACGLVRAGELAGPYTDPRCLTDLPFGTTSEWMQPWRCVLETMPAGKFVDGVGINMNLDQALARGVSADDICRTLAEHGIHQGRVEENWGQLNWDETSRMTPQRRSVLLAMKKYGIRPTVLVNAHCGAPCPLRQIELKVLAAAEKGDRSITLDNVSGLKPDYSGLSDLTDYWAAENLITAIDGNVCTLAKPLSKPFEAGSRIKVATLMYRPFEKPGSAAYRVTLQGWLKNLEIIRRDYAEIFGSRDDCGFDIEIWNELTFGSHFLYINDYYATPRVAYNNEDIFGALATDTAAYVASRGDAYRGAIVEDSFSNTIPWTAASREHPRVSAIGKHPYPPVFDSPPARQPRGKVLNALGQPDSNAFVPAYRCNFPEYQATAIQTETVMRDAAPLTTDIYGVAHGRLSRTVDGKALPCALWITESNVSPKDCDPAVKEERAMEVKAKFAARFFSFFLNKGVDRAMLYAACGNDPAAGDREFNTLPQRFKRIGDDAGPVLAVTQRMVNRLSTGLDRQAAPRAVKVDSIADTHDHVIFRGDGTAAHPDLFHREVFAVLPYQVNARRMVIVYYVMTRDIMAELPPEAFDVALSGFAGTSANVSVYDPFANRTERVPFVQDGGRLNLQLVATDRPRMLVIDLR